MNWIDFAFILLVVAAGAAGFRKGIIKILVFVSAYLLGIFFAIALYEAGAALITSRTGISPVLARITALISIFVIVSLLTRCIGLLLGKITRAVLPGIDRTAGLLLGLAFSGVIIGLAVIYMSTAEENSTPRRLHEDSVISRALLRHAGGILPPGCGPENLMEENAM